MQKLSRLAADRSGTAAIEFSIVSGAFLSLIFGISYLGIFLFDQSTLPWAVERASRLAAINKAVTQNQITAAVNGYLTSAGVPGADVQYSVSNAAGFPVANISASFRQTYTVPLVATFNMTYSASTSVPQGG
jgi:Flp pilus assembly protein TadG